MSFLIGDFLWGSFDLAFMNSLSASLCNQTMVFSQSSYKLSVTLTSSPHADFDVDNSFTRKPLMTERKKKSLLNLFEFLQ